MKKIIITGGAGFIGSHLCEKLLQDETNLVVGIDNVNNYYNVFQKKDNIETLEKYKNFTFHEQDLVYTNLIEETKPDIVINLGAMAGVRYSIDNPTIYTRVNVEGQTHLLNESVKNNVKLFIYASSSSVYGTSDKEQFTETDEINSLNSPYAVTKRCGELIAGLYNKLYGLKTIGLRFFTVYGPRGRPDMAPYKFLYNIINSKPILKFGTGESKRDYTYVDDIVNGILGAIKNKNNRACEVYNLGNNKPASLNTFIETCEKVTSKTCIFEQLPDQQGDVPYTCANINKAKNDLDYEPKVTLEEGLKNTYEWMINQ